MITNVMTTTLHFGLGTPFQVSNAIIFINNFIARAQEITLAPLCRQRH